MLAGNYAGSFTIIGPLSLALERDLVVALDCPSCGGRAEVFRPRARVRQAEARCQRCGEPARPEILNVVEDDSPLVSRTLAELGVPPYDIVRVDGAEESGFFLLAADRVNLAGEPSRSGNGSFDAG